MRRERIWLLGPAASAVEQVHPVLLVHRLPEIGVLQSAGIRHHFDVDADVVAALLVLGVIQRPHQVMMVDQVELLLSHDDGNGPHAQVIVQLSRIVR